MRRHTWVESDIIQQKDHFIAHHSCTLLCLVHLRIQGPLSLVQLDLDPCGYFACSCLVDMDKTRLVDNQCGCLARAEASAGLVHTLP